MLPELHKGFRVAKTTGRTLLILCAVIVTAGRTIGAESSIQHSPNASAAFNSVFAIADFDGDRKPDLATVEIQNGNSTSGTEYSIRFRLTTGAAQSFGVLAPAGGLQIVARDVNGDDAMDLLISTAWLHQEVAVLLNDGHGNFTLANPGEFPAAVWESATVWESGAVSRCDSAALVSSENSARDLEAINRLDCLRQQRGHGLSQTLAGKARLLLFSLLGRAPPGFTSEAQTR
ncbi:MAG: VCBS repeat-containing protein [Candidatus Acidiferrum sp.]